MNKMKDADFMAKFPPALKKDKSMLALGQLIAKELHITAHETKKNIIYANIEGLSETWLDVLAYDLHVDWYDYDHTLETKRDVIKKSARIHQKLGTKYAVETALKDIYESAEIEEWFEYGGEPYMFRIKIDISKEGITDAEREKIREKMGYYKNIRSHCENLTYKLGGRGGMAKTAQCAGMRQVLMVRPYGR